MKHFALLVLASAIVASVQSMDLVRPGLINHPAVSVFEDAPYESIIILDDYPEEFLKAVEEEEDEQLGGKSSVVNKEMEHNIDAREYSRYARSPKEPVSGKVVVSAGARKGSSTGGKTEGNVYVGGQIRFRRSTMEENDEELSRNPVAGQQFETVGLEKDVTEDSGISVLATDAQSVKIAAAEVTKENSSADEISSESRVRRSPEPRRHRTNVDIEFGKKIYDGKHGSIDVSGGARKRPGERWDPHVGISGSIRF